MNKKTFETLPTKNQTADAWFHSLCLNDDEAQILSNDDGLFRRHLICRLIGDNNPEGACIHCDHRFHEGKCLTSTISPSGKTPTVHCECSGHGSPIDMILPCPSCGMLHIDAPEPNICICGCKRTEHKDPELLGVCNKWDCCKGFEIAWDNPPHKSHLCHGCGIIWRPADVPTNGVAAIKTHGEKDTWDPHETCVFCNGTGLVEDVNWEPAWPGKKRIEGDGIISCGGCS